MDEEQIGRIENILSEKKRIYIYGKGSSGLVGMEMKMRFMRIGVNMEAITDDHIMRMNSVLLDQDCAVIGISVSGKTMEVIESLKAAKRCGAAVILMTSHIDKDFRSFCDEVMLCAVKENLEQGKAISPQFPILIMVDTIYYRMLRSDKFRRETLHDYTLEALDEKSERLDTEKKEGRPDCRDVPPFAGVVCIRLIVFYFTFKVSSWMCAYRAYFRSFISFMNISAVSAFPA